MASLAATRMLGNFQPCALIWTSARAGSANAKMRADATARAAPVAIVAGTTGRSDGSAMGHHYSRSGPEELRFDGRTSDLYEDVLAVNPHLVTGEGEPGIR